MFRFMYNPQWKFVNVYCGEIKIGTINYVESQDEAYDAAKEMYENYVQQNNKAL